jgi:cytochrome c2
MIMMAAIAFSNYNRDWKQYQRAYYYELNQRAADEAEANAEPQAQNLSFLDSILASLTGTADGVMASVETELQLGMQKIVTDPGRTADLCMTCHINVGSEGFDEEPLKDLIALHTIESDDPEIATYIIDNYPFDTFGCTACHGGQPLSLDPHHAHEFMADTMEDFFLLKVAELTAPNWIIRQKALEKIRWLTGDDFGYDHAASPEEMDITKARIMEWWELHKATFFLEGFGDRASPFKTVNPIKEEIVENPRLSSTGKVLEYVNNDSCIGCHTTLYEGRKRDAQASGSTDSIKAIQTQLDHVRLWAEIDLSDITLADEAFSNLAANYSCQMCHGPGEEYFQLMQKGYSLELQGRSIEASDLLGKAASIARENARVNLSRDPRLWELFQNMARKISGIEATEVESSSTEETSASTEETQAETPTDDADTNADDSDTSTDSADTDTSTDEDTSTNEGQSSDAGDNNDSEALLIETGQSLSAACLNCHSIDGSALVGPTWQGLYGRTVTLDDGTTLTADDDYIKKSILDPGSQIVEGFFNSMPPYPFDDEELNAIIAYIKSLSN